jgi:hypothetical protein
MRKIARSGALATRATASTGVPTKEPDVESGYGSETHGARYLARNNMLVVVVVAVAAVVLGGACSTPPPPAGSPDVVVFDIDGTLTTDQLSTTPHAGAAAAVNAYVAKGYNVVYVTARWKSAQESSTRRWLSVNGFPSRPLYLSPNLVIDDRSTVSYKTATLQSIEQGAPEVVYAYGDSDTDFAAYANVGVPRSRVYALKRASALTCQPGSYNACMSSYTEHLDFINSLPDAS